MASSNRSGSSLAHGAHHLEGERHVAALVAEHPVGAGRQAVQQAARAQEVDVGERGEEEQAFDAGGEADQVEQELAALLARFQPVQVLDRVDPLEAELAFLADRRNGLDRRERLVALGRIGDVGVEQGEVELHVQRFLVELARQVHARFGRVDVLVQIQHQVVRDDGVAGGEERHQPLDQVALGGGHLRAEVADVHREIHFLDGPGVLDRVAVHLVERRVAHRAQGELEAGVEDVRMGCCMKCSVGTPGSVVAQNEVPHPCGMIRPGRVYWHASQYSGFSSEQNTAALALSDRSRPGRWPGPAHRHRRHRGLGDPRRRARAQVVRGLHARLPRVHVHRAELADVRVLHEQVQRLALVDVGAARGGQVDQRLLRQLPHGAVDRAQAFRELRAMPWIEPSASLIASRISVVHRPSVFSSSAR